MTRKLLNKIAGTALALLALAVAADMCIILFTDKYAYTALPDSYRAAISLLCWGGAALLGLFAYLAARRFVKA